MPERKAKPPSCTGKRADGRPCKQSVIPETTRCWHHSFKVPGRPSRLTPELQERILDGVLEGAYMETAAQAAGVQKALIYRWIRRGEEAEARALEQFDSDTEPSLDELYEHIDPSDWAYVDFRHALQSAEAHSELELLRKVTTRHGSQPWQAYMTVLERRHPARWRRTDRVELDGQVDVGRPVIVEVESEAKRAQIAGILATAGAIPAAPVKPPRKPRRPS